MGVILAIVSVILSIILFPVGLLMTFFNNLYRKKWKLSLRRLDQQFLGIAISIDTSGNVVCKDLFNLILKQRGGVEFGNRKETISSVLGKNQRDDTLTGLGKALAFVMDKIDPNHCLKSIDELV